MAKQASDNKLAVHYDVETSLNDSSDLSLFTIHNNYKLVVTNKPGMNVVNQYQYIQAKFPELHKIGYVMFSCHIIWLMVSE